MPRNLREVRGDNFDNAWEITDTPGGGKLDIGTDLTISHLVEMNVSNFADAPALKDGLDNSMTYAQMGDRIDQICNALLSDKISEGSFVGIYQEPTVDWICCLLAIWKIGAIYVPLDARQSMERLKTIAEDCKPQSILVHEATAADVDNILPTGSRTIDVSEITTRPSIAVAVAAKPHTPSTILYTSGSTGKPKGVLLNSFGLLNHCIVYAKTHGFGQERLLQQSALSFDMSPYQTIIALYNGGSVYVASKTQRFEPSQIARAIAEEGLTCTIATPSEYNAWIKHGSQDLSAAKKWRFAISGGEAIEHTLLAELRGLQLHDLKLLNVYGPSEISIGAVSIEVNYQTPDPTAIVPLGRPMQNYAVYIVDGNMGQVPIGVDGELVIAGAGVANGYWDRADMTAAKFLPDTITSRGHFESTWSSKMYRTGDIGRRQADGTILFKGRAAGDTQIKLNGIRIELSDIENVIVDTAKGALLKAVCSVRGGVLVAHAEFTPAYPTAQRERLLSQLAASLPLPPYMSPGRIVALDKMPLTSHGKVDRAAIAKLPLERSTPTDGNETGLTETERTLKEIWQQVLPEEIVSSAQITADTDFFFCGGNSLSIVNVQSLIRKRLNVSLPIVELLQSTLLRAMALKIDAAASVAIIDWDAETKLENSLATAVASKMPRKVSLDKAGMSVILTGATGYLGRFLVQQLVNDPLVSKIHCIAVRPDGDKPRDILRSSDRIVAHAGNLAEPNFGLSDEAFDELINDADAIIHNGANRSFWDQYHVIRGTNFSSTKELIRVSAHHGIPMHFISSSGVVDLAGPGATASEKSMSAFKPPTDGSSGYIASKWASEVYIEKAVAAYELPLHVHRVMPTEPTSEASPKLLERFLSVADSMKVVPEWQGWSGSFDIVPAADLAESICRAAVDEALHSKGAGELFRHHVCQYRLQLADLQRYMESIKGEQREGYETCPPHEWAGKAKRAGVEWHFASMEFKIEGEDGVVLELKR